MSVTDSALLTATRFTVLDTNGNPVSGALIHTYLAGTQTPLATYADPYLTTPNTNPVTADSSGRAVLWLQSQAYKIVVNDATDTLLYSIDNYQGGMGGASSRSVCNGRITGTSGNAVTDTASTTTIYFTPYGGDWISLYSGAAWVGYEFSELSLGLGTDASGRNYDLFCYANAGTPTLERLAWASDSARGTALTTQNGILVKSGDATRRYLGTYRTNGIGTTVDTGAFRFIWNYYNRVSRSLRVGESTASWVYTTATFRQANGSTANQVAFVLGMAEVTVNLQLQVEASNTGTAANVGVAVGEDATNAIAANALVSNPALDVAGTIKFVTSTYTKSTLTAGYHFLAWLEQGGATGTTTWYGFSAGAVQSGLSGTLSGG